jgi:hypothetical protein
MRKSRRRAPSAAVLGTLAALLVLVLGPGSAAATEIHPSLSVTATPSITCAWSIEKTGSSDLTLAVDQGFDVPFTVAVTKTCTNDVHGTVTGTGDPGGNVTVTVGGVAAIVSGCASDGHAGTFSCNYDGHPATAADTTVDATATYADGTASGSTAVSFHGVVPAENSVDILDSNLASPLAIHLDHSETFNYTVHVSYATCGPHTLDNTAIVMDSVELARSSHSVHINVPCASGCTLTQGYWKTHSKYGPAPSDPAWNNITPSGPDTPFFLSGQTWYQVFKTSAATGNAYYILAYQYMAARLNILDGASSTAAVNAALAWATTFFSTYTPAQIGALSKDSALRATAISNASTLDSYNNGATGPGHCDE